MIRRALRWLYQIFVAEHFRHDNLRQDKAG